MSSTSHTLAFLHPILTKIIGQPSNTSITLLTREIYANAHSIPSLCGGGAHGHLGMFMSNAAYQLLTNVAFTLPNHPGTNPNHPSLPKFRKVSGHSILSSWNTPWQPPFTRN